MKTVTLGSTTVGRSFMKMTSCCQGTGITPDDCIVNLTLELLRMFHNIFSKLADFVREQKLC